MKQVVIATSLFVFIVNSGGAIAGKVSTECQEQAKEYNIQAELVSQYVKDCIASMGGEVPSPGQALGGADSATRSGVESAREDSSADQAGDPQGQ